MKKRVIALALCLVMLATCLGAGMLAPTPVTLVDENGAAATSAAVPQLGRKTLTASYADATETTAYQWQFSNDGDTWIDIYGETAQTCSLSYAKVKNMLDADGKAQLRCVVTDGEDERVSSAATVTVDYSAQTAEAATEAQPGVSLKAAPARAASYARSAAPLDAGEHTNYSVVINYVFADGTQAANPWTANIAKGSSINQTVTSPTVLGYAPDQAEVVVNVTDIQKDVTYTVTYNPAEVEFTVKHYQQNVSNDDYTLVDTETKKGYTKNPVGESLAKKYEGFYALLYEKPAIAADGSTVVEIYYDRYYYLMNFDLDGGYGVEPIYARFGAPISVGTPTKAGYTFGGWSFNGSTVTELPEAMPAENRTYKAVWNADDTAKVTIVFWGENADDEEYSYIRSMQVDATPGASYSYDGSTLTCPLAEHSHGTSKCELNCKHHTVDCYYTRYGFTETKKPTANLTTPGNGIYTYTTSNWWESTTHYYLNIGDKWYCGTNRWGNADDTKSISFDCKHTHTDACYSCGLTEHTHSSACSGLWTFKESDTVTVAADGSSVVNVYYDRVEKTLTFKYNYSNRNYQSTETITAKWGSDISEQYKKIAANAKSTFWSAETSGDGPYTNYFGIMPQTSATYYNRGKTGDTGTMTYWGQDLNGDYTVKLFEVTGVGGYYVTDEDRYKFQGFTYHHGTDNGSDCEGAAFYYTRNSYTLTFNDGYADVKTESVKYQAPLSAYSGYVPEVPGAYEPGSVTFGGWYLNPECTGAEYKLDEHTMPADNVLLYAKWVPVTHTVRTYLTKDAMAGAPLETQTVPHGSTATEPADPTNGNYTFVGWFYEENGVEKAFVFSMPVNKDLDLYAKWSSNKLMQYTIKYQLEDGTTIAPDTTGSALAGSTKTFDAKTGTQLNEGYQSGYFPTTNSHSMTMDIDGNNEYTFVYVPKAKVNYTVKYLEVGTNAVLHTEKSDKTEKAIITETFEPVRGYAPDAYQKRLVLSANDADNVIIFWYTKDEVHAPVQVIHWIQNVVGDGYTEYQSSTNLNGVIGEKYSEEHLSIAGFKYNSEKSNDSGTLTEAGLVLNLYYDRVEYPYEFRFLEQGTDKVLETAVTGTARYQAQVTRAAKTIPGYKLVSAANQAINIAIEDGSTAVKNVKTFYYTENEVTIGYQVVGPEGCGTLDNYSETVKVKTGTPSGSTATANSPTFRFVGWYLDKDCTQAAPNGWVDENNKLTPQKGSDGMYKAATYYAKFEKNLTDLTIKKEMESGSAYDANDMFIFTVTDSEGKEVAKVALKAGQSVTIKNLTVGETYTVTEDNNWSWRYKDVEAQTITLNPTGNEVTVTNTLVNNNWLGASSYAINRCVKNIAADVFEIVKNIFGN